VNSSSIVKGKPWIAKDHDRRAAMEIRLLKCSLRGSGLGELLEDVSGQRVSLLREPPRSDSFGTESGRRITSLSVSKME
jgi:hypothetical protein